MEQNSLEQTDTVIVNWSFDKDANELNEKDYHLSTNGARTTGLSHKDKNEPCVHQSPSVTSDSL